MAAGTIFRFMDVPPELRFLVYSFLDLVDETPLSIFAVADVPLVIRKTPKAMREEMLDVFLGQNRFSIISLIGLPQLFAKAEAKAHISRIRRLCLRVGPPEQWQMDALVARGGGGLDYDYRVARPGLKRPGRRELRIELTRSEPGFDVEWADGSQNDRVFTSMEFKMDESLSRPGRDGFRTFDCGSVIAIAEHWVQCRW